MKLIHGGDWAGYETEYGCRPLDYSANVSPLGLPEGVRNAVIKSLDDAALYPDPLCRRLSEAIGEHYDISPEWVLCGNGAADIIFRLAYALKAKEAIVTAPAFSEYSAALRSAGTTIVHYALSEEKDFIPGEDIVDLITPDTGVIFLCEPSNPAGVLCGRELLLKVLNRCRECGTILALDECFGDFLDDPEEHSLISELHGGNLIILKAFTKFYGMAGLRCGYCLCADTELLERMSLCGAPWNVSVPAQAAGIAALQEKDYTLKLREIISAERAFLYDSLISLGLRVIPGKANFMLFYCCLPELRERLRAKSILIRSCDNYEGLTPGWYRIAVRNHDDNLRLIRALKEELQDG